MLVASEGEGKGPRSSVVEDGALLMEMQATGAEVKLEPWDGDIFTTRLMPAGRFGPVVDLDYKVKGFAQFQMGKDRTLDRLRLTTEDGQSYEFSRK